MNQILAEIKMHEYWMQQALQQAKNAAENNEVPVGAIIVNAEGVELSGQFNRKEMNYNPVAHAEILCIQEAAEKIKNWRLIDCTLYVTLEPCPMCFSAIAQARIKNVVFGAYDLKGGSVSLGYHFHKDQRLNHRFNIMGGVSHYECSKVISDFFKLKRQPHLI